MKKTALIFGITGQDGSYCAELLLKKNYKVFGMIRKSATGNTKNIEHLIKDKKKPSICWVHLSQIVPATKLQPV